jgi:hypothetical protein
MPARAELLEMITRPDVFEQPRQLVEGLQLEAARELFRERIEQIPVLSRRAKDTGVDEIRSLNDIVPLVFAHTAYKSYPQTFVDEGRWDQMLRWLNTLSVEDTTNVDVTDVKDVDDWLTRLHEVGHLVLATTGSTGKCSFLNQTVGDHKSKARHYSRTYGWPTQTPNQDRPFFAVSPSRGFNGAIEVTLIIAEQWARPGAKYFLTDEPLRIREVSQMAALRKRMAEGSATPNEIRSAEESAAARAEDMKIALRQMAARLVECRREPIFIIAQWAQHLMLIEAAKAMGVKDGEFHRDSIWVAGGGIKGVTMPADYKERVKLFYAGTQQRTGYGMTEVAQRMPRCEANRYHCTPGLILLPLDQLGERLLSPTNGDGTVVEGRFACLDLLFEGRWGGVISGDKVTVDYSAICPCGRPGPTILDNVSRLTQIGLDDHIGCAGTIDSYIKGIMSQ